MTIREYLTNILQRTREMEVSAKSDSNYGKALKQQGAIEITELIFMQFINSQLMDKEI